MIVCCEVEITAHYMTKRYIENIYCVGRDARNELVTYFLVVAIRLFAIVGLTHDQKAVISCKLDFNINMNNNDLAHLIYNIWIKLIKKK